MSVPLSPILVLLSNVAPAVLPVFVLKTGFPEGLLIRHRVRIPGKNRTLSRVK